MMWDYSWGPGQWLAMAIMMALAVGIGVVVVAWLVRETGMGTRHPETPREPRPVSPQDILDERFARGEISEEELVQRRNALTRTDSA